MSNFPSDAIETLARWHNTFNHWDWPEDLPGKPDGYDDWTIDAKLEYTRPYWAAIEQLVDDKERLRWHWLYNLSRTNDEFEAWYAERGGVNDEK